MAGKFEWQFKYRDEADVNGRPARARELREVPDLQALLRFVRFGLPCDFRTSITIAHGDTRAWLHFVEGAARERPHGDLALRPAHPRLPCRRAQASIAQPRRATAPRSDQRCGETDCRQYPGLRERGRRRTRQDQIPNEPEGRLWNCGALLKETRTERRKLCFFCRTVKSNDPTVDLMSRRHPLSSTRTSRRR